MKEFKIVIACGGTGGHIFPAVALAEDIKNLYPGATICFAGVFNGRIANHLRDSGFRVYHIKGRGMPHKPGLGVLFFAYSAIASFIKALAVLRNTDAGIVVSMGSFSGAPFVFAGKLLGMPVLIHEQNVMPGRANRLCSYFADKIAISFEDTAQFFSKKIKRRITVTGNPVRSSIFTARRAEALEFFGFKAGKFTIMLTGGSQGAHNVNAVFTQAAKQLDPERFQILHLCGEKDYDFVSGEYKNINADAKVFAFLEEMDKAYAISDLVISRAGATTIAEIAAMGLASILIPYPYGDRHQSRNAYFLRDRKAALVIEENNLTKDRLVAIINEVFAGCENLQRLRKNSSSQGARGAAGKLSKEVVNFLL